MRAGDLIDYLPLQVEYAKLCSLIREALYSQNVLSKPLATLETAAEFLHQQLDAWVSQIPGPLWGGGIPAYKRGFERRLYLQLRLQYYEALLALDSRWLYPESTFPDRLNQQRSQACKRCVRTAKMILESYDGVCVADILANRQALRRPQPKSVVRGRLMGSSRTLIYPLLVAVRIMFLAVILNWSDSDDILYLAMACGLFGRLSIGSVVPLGEVIELSRAAQQLRPAQGLSDKPSLV